MRISSLENLYFRKLFGSLYNVKIKSIEEAVRNEEVGGFCLIILIFTIPALVISFVACSVSNLVEKFFHRHSETAMWMTVVLIILPIIRFTFSLMEKDEDLKRYNSFLNGFLKAVNFSHKDDPNSYAFFNGTREEMIQVIDLGGVPALESLIQSRFAHDLIEWIVAIERGAGGIGSCGTLKSHKDAIEDLGCIVTFSKALGLNVSGTERFLKEHTISYNIPEDEEYILEYP